MGRRSTATLTTHLVPAEDVTVIAVGVFEKNTIVCLVLKHLRHATSSRTGSGKEKEAC